MTSTATSGAEGRRERRIFEGHVRHTRIQFSRARLQSARTLGSGARRAHSARVSAAAHRLHLRVAGGLEQLVSLRLPPRRGPRAAHPFVRQSQDGRAASSAADWAHLGRGHGGASGGEQGPDVSAAHRWRQSAVFGVAPGHCPRLRLRREPSERELRLSDRGPRPPQGQAPVEEAQPDRAGPSPLRVAGRTARRRNGGGLSRAGATDRRRGVACRRRLARTGDGGARLHAQASGGARSAWDSALRRRRARGVCHF